VINNFETFCRETSTSRLFFWGLVLVGVIGLLDFATGPEISFSIFYLLPVSLAAWFVSRRIAMLLAVASAITWLLVEQAGDKTYALAWAPLWNAAVRLAFFALTAYLLSELKRHLDRERSLLRLDLLTGARNTQSFREEARFLLKLAARHQQPTALAHLVLERFDSASSALGAAEGDRILQTVVMALTLSVRSTDVVGRVAPHEFAILLPQTDLAGARQALDKCHARVGHIIRDKGWPISPSVGVVVFPEGARNASAALKHAGTLAHRLSTEDPGGIVYETQEAAAATAATAEVAP
jgi:diguanylate cyclase (GGDEF)-like protein